jgi:hypothetical protein
MGFRFRRSIKLLPGIRLNVSKSGVSTSIGGRGAHINIGPRGTRGTVGIPGTGISYSERLDSPTRARDDAPDSEQPATGLQRKTLPVLWMVILLLVALLALFAN